MKICGIISEYNPLHNGHIEHINFSKSQSNCDTVICIMSGNFTQRGEIAINNKFTRAKNAILAGADIVLELPTVFATSSAQDFAYGGVNLLSCLNADYLSFGSECGDVNLLNQVAEYMSSDKVNKNIRENMQQGLTYPKAVNDSIIEKFGKILTPNNLLALEYINAVKRLSSTMECITLFRKNNYDDANISSSLASALAVRTALNNNDTTKIKECVPSYVFNSLVQNNIESRFNDFIYNFYPLINADYLKNIYDVTEGIENRIISSCLISSDYNEFIKNIKTKRYTQAKIQRILLRGILNITAEVMNTAKNSMPYATVLAVNKDRNDLLKYVYSKLNYKSTLNEAQEKVFKIDNLANNFYNNFAHTVYEKNFLQKI